MASSLPFSDTIRQRGEGFVVSNYITTPSKNMEPRRGGVVGGSNNNEEVQGGGLNDGKIVPTSNNYNRFGNNNAQLLPADWKPTPYTVIIGRGKSGGGISSSNSSTKKTNPGNEHLEAICQSFLESYSKPGATKNEKSAMVSRIVEIVEEACIGRGGFVKLVNGRYSEVIGHGAREKVGYVMRDLLSAKYRSSSKSRVERRRRQRLVEAQAQVLQASQQQRKGGGSKDSDAPAADTPISGRVATSSSTGTTTTATAVAASSTRSKNPPMISTKEAPLPPAQKDVNNDTTTSTTAAHHGHNLASTSKPASVSSSEAGRTGMVAPTSNIPAGPRAGQIPRTFNLLNDLRMHQPQVMAQQTHHLITTTRAPAQAPSPQVVPAGASTDTTTAFMGDRLNDMARVNMNHYLQQHHQSMLMGPRHVMMPHDRLQTSVVLQHATQQANMQQQMQRRNSLLFDHSMDHGVGGGGGGGGGGGMVPARNPYFNSMAGGEGGTLVPPTQQIHQVTGGPPFSSINSLPNAAAMSSAGTGAWTAATSASSTSSLASARSLLQQGTTFGPSMMYDMMAAPQPVGVAFTAPPSSSATLNPTAVYHQPLPATPHQGAVAGWVGRRLSLFDNDPLPQQHQQQQQQEQQIQGDDSADSGGDLSASLKEIFEP